MNREARYKNLQTDNFVAKNIVADSITLRDEVIKSNVMTAGATIKNLYEKQRDTNAFTDSMKNKLESLDSTIQRNNNTVTLPATIVKLPLLSEIDYKAIPNQHALTCFDNDGNVIYICNFNDTIKHYTLPVYEPYIEFKLNIQNEECNVNLNVK